MPGVTPSTPLGGWGMESISSSSGKKVAIVRSALVIEYGYLPVESTNGTIYIDFSQLHAGVINEVAGSEIITSVYNDIVGADDFIRILFSQSCGIGIDLHIMVQGFETFSWLG